MKKILSALVLFSFLAVLAAPTGIAMAQNDTVGPPEGCTITRDMNIEGCPSSGDCNFADNKMCGMCCLLQTIYNITDWVFVILIALASVFIIMGAVYIMTAGGNTERVTSGRNYIMYAAIGLIIGFLAKAIPNLVIAIAGFGG